MTPSPDDKVVEAERCENCAGDGWYEWVDEDSNEHECTCEECGGTGELPAQGDLNA